MRAPIVASLTCLLALVSGCGTGEPAAEPTTSSTTSTTPATSAAPVTSTTIPDWVGPPLLVTVHTDDLVAVDLADTNQADDRITVLARRGQLASAHGVIEGLIEGVDLSPDGSTAVFTFAGQLDGQMTYGLYQVPTDGSADPVRLEIPGVGGPFSHPRFSPDGELLALYAGDRLITMPTDGGPPPSAGIAMPYPPVHLTWSTDGDRLLWLPHYGRSACCQLSSAQIDPATGEIDGDVRSEPTDGRPYFDAHGELRTQREWTHWALDLDVTNQFALSVDAGSAGNTLQWWDTTEPDTEPRALELGLRLSEVSPVAW